MLAFTTRFAEVGNELPGENTERIPARWYWYGYCNVTRLKKTDTPPTVMMLWRRMVRIREAGQPAPLTL